MLISRTALCLAVCLLSSVALAQGAEKKPAADREKIEARFVELMRVMLKSPPTDKAAGTAMMEELKTLMFTLSGIDPKNPPPDAGKRISEMQAEILSRRAPELRDQLLQQTQLFACRSKQIEAKGGLKGLSTMQEQTMADTKKYAKTLKELDADLIVSPKRYGYEMVESTAKHFKVRAIGKDDMAGDVWEVDERGQPENTTNACKKFQAAP
jgi:hypothetical protein